MSDRNRVRPLSFLPLALVLGAAAAAPALPSTSVAETALQSALAAPVQAAAAVAQPTSQPATAAGTSGDVTAQRSPVVPSRTDAAALAAPASQDTPVKPTPVVAPVKPAQPTPVKVATAVKPAKVVKTVATVVRKPMATKPVAKTASKPAPTAEQLRQQAIAQAQRRAPVRTARSVLARSTAYNSFAAQTDSSPTITATGTRVRFGVIALSRDLLRVFPYGTRVTIEDLSGRYAKMLAGKVFVVEDSMHPRMYNTVDVWMPTMSQALSWGNRNVRITAVR